MRRELKSGCTGVELRLRKAYAIAACTLIPFIVHSLDDLADGIDLGGFQEWFE